jgi:hypothetical protein
MEEIQLENRTIWSSCCLRTDKTVVIYLSQLAFAFSVLGFSCTMLVASDGNCEQSSPYFSLISFLMGKLLSSVVDTK